MLSWMPWIMALVFLALGILVWGDPNRDRRERAFISFLGLMLAPFSLIVLTNLDAEKRQQDQTLRNTNMIQYIQQWQAAANSMPVLTAFTTDHVNLRTEPNTNSRVIRTLDVNVKVTINDWQGDWFQGTVDNDTGWLHGQYLRPITYGEKDIFIQNGWDAALKYTFPEDTQTGQLIGVAVGWLIGALISIGIHILLYL